MITYANNDAAPSPPGHAKIPRKVQRTAGKSSEDPILEDCLLSATALCAELATEDVATLARASEMSASWASDLRRNGAKGSFIHRTTVLTYRLAQNTASRAWAIIAHLKATAKQAIMPVSNAELVERFWDLIEAENAAEARENLAVGQMGRTHNLEPLKRACLEEAAIQEELAAVIAELQRRRINPFDRKVDA